MWYKIGFNNFYYIDEEDTVFRVWPDGLTSKQPTLDADVVSGQGTRIDTPSFIEGVSFDEGVLCVRVRS